jgi:hypothetical protein
VEREAEGHALGPRSEGLLLTGVPVRDFVMVDDKVWAYFRRRWREIDREHWGPGAFGEALLEPEGATVLRACVAAAREELRLHVRQIASSSPGGYLIPV